MIDIPIVKNSYSFAFVKKLVVAIVSLFYLVSASGATVQLHYCMGKLVEAGIWHHEQSDKCSSCGMQKKASKKNNCCRDEQKKLTQVNDQKLAEQAYLSLQVASVALPIQWSFQPAENLFSVTVAYPVSHAPPRGIIQPIYLLNSNFRI